MRPTWQTFYVMVGGAAAALTGLIFVAVSLHTRSIMSGVLHRDRAWSSIALLMSQPVHCDCGPRANTAEALGLEIDLIALFWLYRTVWARSGGSVDADRRSASRPLAAGVAQLDGLARRPRRGRRRDHRRQRRRVSLLALAMVGMFGFGIWSHGR